METKEQLIKCVKDWVRIDNEIRLLQKELSTRKNDKKNIKKLIASGGGWFIYDVAYYGVNLFAGEILSHLTDDDGNVSSNKSVRDITSKQLIANSVTIPAVVLTIALTLVLQNLLMHIMLI